jgi:hypothetical protein
MTDAFVALLDEPRWLAWREEERRGRRTKMPYAATPGARGPGSSTKSATWGTHAEAKQRARQLDNGSTTGCGIVLGDIGDQLYLAGLDLDSSLDEKGVLAAWAVKILSAVHSYAEVSPSGRGLKAFFYIAAEEVRPFLNRIGVDRDKWGTKRGIPGLSGADHGPGIELYCSGRYFTVTGRVWSADQPHIVQLDYDQLEVLAALLPAPSQPGRNQPGDGHDTSRSAKAFRAAFELRAASYEEMCEGVRNHADPEIKAWVDEKGEAYGGRGLRLIWSRIKAARAGNAASPNAAPSDDDENGDWGEPDLDVLRLHRRIPPSLPVDLFGPWTAWIHEAAGAAACPIDYVLAPLLASASVLIGHARWAQAVPGWIEPPHLWIGAVGDSGNGKSPGADCLMRDVLPEIERKMRIDFPDQLRDWQATNAYAKAAEERWKSEVRDAEKKGTPPPSQPAEMTIAAEPQEPRLRQHDITIERVATLLATAAPKGLLIVRDELAGWINGMNVYNDAGRSFWIEAYGGRPYRVERQRNEPLQIARLAVGVYGGTQPDKLAELMRQPDDGLLSRILWTWPEPVPFGLNKRTPHIVWAVDALDRLRMLDLQPRDGTSRPVLVALDDEGQAEIECFGREMQQRQLFAGGLMRSAYGKARGLALRLSLVLEYLWWCGTADFAGPPASISPAAFCAARQLVADYFMPMAEGVYGDAATSRADRNAATLARWIVRQRPVEVYVRELQRRVRLPGLNMAEDIHAAASVLGEAGWLTAPPRGAWQQRPRSAYPINPRLWELLDVSHTPPPP